MIIPALLEWRTNDSDEIQSAQMVEESLLNAGPFPWIDLHQLGVGLLELLTGREDPWMTRAGAQSILERLPLPRRLLPFFEIGPLVVDRFDHLPPDLFQALGNSQGPKLSDEVTYSLPITLKRGALPPVGLKPGKCLNSLDDVKINESEEALQAGGFFWIHLG